MNPIRAIGRAARVLARLAAASPLDGATRSIHEEVVMNCIRRICRSLADRARPASPLPAPGVTVPAALGRPAAAATRLEQASAAACSQPPVDRPRPVRPTGHPDRGHARAAGFRAGGDRVPDVGRETPRGRQRRRNDPVTTIAPGLLPRTIQLCVHCQQRPAGFWVRRTGGMVVRRPWCMSCSQDLDRDDYDVIPFGS